MCGRYVSTAPAGEIAHYFDAAPHRDVAIEPNWNVAPTDPVLVVLDDDGGRRVDVHRWGLVPGWAKDPSVGSRMINARAETVAERSAFKRAFDRRRCLIPADGFYEWEKLPGQKTKQPWFVHRCDGEPMAFAGLWEQWRGTGPDGIECLRSATILTTRANQTMEPIHDRMPVILPRSAWGRWLDRDNRDTASLAALLVPAPEDMLALRAVGAAVGNVANDGPGLIEPIDAAAGTSLFDAKGGHGAGSP